MNWSGLCQILINMHIMVLLHAYVHTCTPAIDDTVNGLPIANACELHTYQQLQLLCMYISLWNKYFYDST